MRKSRLIPLTCVATAVAVAVLARGTPGEEKSPFAPSNLTTTSGELADPDSFYEAEVCGECHKQQYEDWQGSLHAKAHHDPIYLAFATLARKEGGDDLYRFCSSCHAAGAVATGEIPGKDEDHTFLTNEGVTCDVCHHVKEVRIFHEGGGSNASIVLDETEIRYGPIKDPTKTPAHESAYSEAHTRAEFCSACHTLTHPHNGVVIENTYAEWKKSPYAAAGIQCQDCHMRTVEQAVEVARTMKPLLVPGPTVDKGEPRPNVFAHTFVGGNANGELTGTGEKTQAIAEARLRSAADMALGLPANAADKVEIKVSITNKGAGHSIPTSITELRQVWIDLTVTDAAGKQVFRSGAVDETGKVDPAAVMYNSVLVDEKGEVTYLPWRAVKIAREKLIHAKETVTERYDVALPADATGPFTVNAVLRYRSAPQDVMDGLFGKGKYPIRTIDMATASGTIPAR